VIAVVHCEAWLGIAAVNFNLLENVLFVKKLSSKSKKKCGHISFIVWEFRGKVEILSIYK